MPGTGTLRRLYPDARGLDDFGISESAISELTRRPETKENAWMNNSADSRTTRREFLKTTSQFASATALGAAALEVAGSAKAQPAVHPGGSDVIQIALVGCGGRGTGAADDAMTAKGGPVKLVAMADVFEDKLEQSHNALKAKCDVPQDHKFIGFDGYKKAMDLLKPGDIVIQIGRAHV